MNERIRELAEQAGLQPYYDKEFIRFAELVRQDEREACARLCDVYQDDYAAAIRARGDRTKTSRDICGND